MKRRGFLGSVIGSVLGAPFVAAAVQPKPGVVSMEALSRNPNLVAGCAVRLTDGTLFRGPGLKDVTLPPVALLTGFDPDAKPARTLFYEYMVVYNFHPIEVKRAFTAVGAVLLDAQDRVVHEKEFLGGPHHVISGDTLRVHHSVTVARLPAPLPLTPENPAVTYLNRKGRHGG